MSDLFEGRWTSRTAAELLHLYRDGLSPVEVVEEVLGTIDEHNPELAAFLSVDADGAVKAAKVAHEIWRSGRTDVPPLLGVPVSVKDTIEVAGAPTTYGSLAFRTNERPDSLVAQRLRAAGAVIVGKTNTSEFALVTEVRNRLGPPSRNPLDLRRTSGGSSGGAAAAVCAGMGVIALGTDSAGSIRVPAAYHGLVGLKPSFQRIPAAQTWRASPNRSHLGPIAKTADDIWLAMRALSGSHWSDVNSYLPDLGERLDPIPDLKGQRVGLFVDEIGDYENEDRRVLIGDLSDFLSQAGAKLETFSYDFLTAGDTRPAGGGWTYAAEHLSAAEAMSPGFWESRNLDLTSYARPIYEFGRRESALEYLAGLAYDMRLGARVRQVVESYDFIASSVCGSPPVIEDDYKPVSFARLAMLNLARVPAVSVPFGSYSDGMPRGVQIAAGFGNDELVMRIAKYIEQELSAPSKESAA